MGRFSKIILAIFLIFLAGCSIDNDEDIFQRYVEATQILKNDLKDPTSMRIYGDILVVDIKDTKGIMLSIIYDSKNSYGAYPGKSQANILLSPDEDPSYVGEGSEHFVDLRYLYEKQEEFRNMVDTGKYEITEEMKESLNSVTFEIISGEQMAKELGVEYYKN